MQWLECGCDAGLQQMYAIKQGLADLAALTCRAGELEQFFEKWIVV